MCWLNIHWADGTESTYENAPRYKDLRNAHRAAKLRCAMSGCHVYIIDEGTVVAHYVPHGEPDAEGHMQTERVA